MKKSILVLAVIVLIAAFTGRSQAPIPPFGGSVPACDQSVPISFITAGPAVSLQLAAPDSRRVGVCAFALQNLNGGVAMKFQRGSCSSSATELTGPFQASTALSAGSGAGVLFSTAPREALCLGLDPFGNVGVQVSGFITFGRF